MDNINSLENNFDNIPVENCIVENSDIGDWYLAKATPFHEKSAIEWLKKMAKDENCENDIIEYFIPQVSKKDLISGEKSKEGDDQKNLKSFMIGYFAVKINLSPTLQKVLYKIQRSISSKYKIIIFQDRKMTKRELEQMKDSLKLVKLSEFSMYQPGDEVIITHDSFQNMSGTLYSICEKTNKASIMLNILGRNVKVEIDLNKLKKKK